jgi:hypothetical protein
MKVTYCSYLQAPCAWSARGRPRVHALSSGKHGEILPDTLQRPQVCVFFILLLRKLVLWVKIPILFPFFYCMHLISESFMLTCLTDFVIII